MYYIWYYHYVTYFIKLRIICIIMYIITYSFMYIFLRKKLLQIYTFNLRLSLDFLRDLLDYLHQH